MYRLLRVGVTAASISDGEIPREVLAADRPSLELDPAVAEAQSNSPWAQFDGLTSLPNRPLFFESLKNQTATAERHALKVAVLLIDIDRFTLINETFGYQAGDALLKQFAERLSSSLRESDTIGRLNGDEFAIIIPGLTADEAAVTVARKLIAALSSPFTIDKQDVFVSASIGGALFPDDAIDLDILVHRAGTALHRAKALGGNDAQFYTSFTHPRSEQRLQLETELRHAAARGEFELHYQPRVSCTTGKIVSFEALLRWNHPERGVVAPAGFIPLLEETGLIVPVSEWILKTACRQVQDWQSAELGCYGVSVNVSGRQLQHASLLPQVTAALAESGLEPALLELELTESMLTEGEQIIAVLKTLKEKGVRISVDDFGTGYSSLSRLKSFPLDALKVDRSFVQDITADPNDASITRAIITLAHSLKLKVVAEGVETEGQLALLVANHCDEIQGYFFSRPLPVADIERLLREGTRLPDKFLLRQARKRTLLLVDDEENILAALKRILRRDGYDILTAGSGQQGLELLAQREVDVIISDQRMPTMTGVEFLRRAKSMYPETVRIVLSGYTELQSIADAINEGAIYKFLTKPWDDGQLRGHIEEAFRRKEMADENRRLQQQVHTANEELADVNVRLQAMLNRTQELHTRDETSLDVAREVLQYIPLPMIGLDADGMVAFANPSAEDLLGQGGLMGREAADVLPASLLTMRRACNADGHLLQSATHIELGGKNFHAICRIMGETSQSCGSLFILMAP
jgi:diguanylate cyclase (GGDEF)-like protein